jgi:hypothetical protein
MTATEVAVPVGPKRRRARKYTSKPIVDWKSDLAVSACSTCRASAAESCFFVNPRCAVGQ